LSSQTDWYTQAGRTQQKETNLKTTHLTTSRACIQGENYSNYLSIYI